MQCVSRPTTRPGALGNGWRRRALWESTWVITALLCSVNRPALAERYSLPQLLAKVRAAYPGILAARQRVAAARAEEAQAARAWAPTGSLDASIFGAGSNTCSPATGEPSHDKAERERNCYHFSLLNTLATGNGVLDQLPRFGILLGLNLYLNQPLYTFGKIEAGVELANTTVDRAREELRNAAEEAIQNATRAYFGVKAGRAARDTLSEVVEKLKEWSGKIEAEMEAANKGGYTEADLARLKTALDSVVVLQLDVDRNLAFAEEGLRVLTDDEEADVDEEELVLTEVVPRPLDWFQDVARLNRPDARLLSVSLRAGAAIRHARRADLLPDLSLLTRFTFAYQSSADSPYNAFMYRPNQLNGTFALWLRLPLDLPLRHQRLVQARADEEVLAERREEALGNIAVEVARAFADHEEARLREERFGHGEKVARGWFTVVSSNMNQGLTVSTDVRELVDAARTYFDLRLRRLQAILDANVTWAALERAAGAS
jgi:outer membrane protein TolC